MPGCGINPCRRVWPGARRYVPAGSASKTQATLERGKRIVELFKQIQYNPISVDIQAAILWTMQNALLDDVAVEKVKDFQARLTDFLSTRKEELLLPPNWLVHPGAC